MRVWGATLAVILALAAAGREQARAQTVTPMAKVDYGRVLGGWREIARLPNRREKKCDHDVQLLLADGNKVTQVQMVESCTEKSGIRDWWSGTLKRDKKAPESGQLKLSYFFLLSHKTWVLAMGPEYEWAVVGSPKRKELWIFSRDAEMQPAALAAAKQTALQQGFHLDKLVMVPQSRLPQAAKPAVPVHQPSK